MAYTADVRFDPEYVSHVLTDNFEDAKTLFLAPLLAIHHAHLVMLADCGIIPAAEAHALREALDSISVADVRRTPYDGTCEDLFFFVDRLLVSACGEHTAGRLHAQIDLFSMQIRSTRRSPGPWCNSHDAS